MASLINFSGIASGIDSSALIDAILGQQRKAQIDPLETQIQELSDTNSALDELSELLSNLNTAVGKFRTINGGVLAKTASSSNETVLSASASNAAQTGTYSVTVGQLARAATYSFADRFAASSTAINSSINNGAVAADRTVTVTSGTGSEQESINIELTNSTTAAEFVTQFNAQSSKAEASLVNVGTSSSPSYALVINTLNTGEDKGTISVNVGSEIQSAGSGAFITASSTLVQAENAEFTVTGIDGTISRGTNTVTDVLSGISLSLLSTGASTVSVSSDKDTTAQSIQDFVDAYNEVFSFIKENDSVTQEQDGGELKNIFGKLSNSAVDDNLLSQLRSALSSSGTSGRTVNILADLGITTQRDGSLAFDEDKFSEAFAEDPQGVEIITQNLGETLGAVNGTIAQFTRFNGLFDATQNSNTTVINNLNNRIATLEAGLGKQQESLTGQFARLEALIGRLNQQQSALSSILPK